MAHICDALVASIAARQHGVVQRKQLIDAGVTPRAIQRRLKARLLRPIHWGVYLTGPVPSPRAREMAAVLACGTHARVGYRTAAALWGFGERPAHSEAVNVKVPGDRVVRRPGIRAYRATGSDRQPPSIVDGIPATSPLETLLDLASVVTAPELERMVARAERAHLITIDDLAAAARQRRGRPGIATLLSVLGQEGGPAYTRSVLEDRFRDTMRLFGLPLPRFNSRVGGLEVDCYWPDARLVAELDGAAYHRSWHSQKNDRRRDSDLAAHDILVVRITWDQLVQETAPTMARLARTLGARQERLRREERE